MIVIDEDRAYKLDDMLRKCDTKRGYYHYNEPDDVAYRDLCTSATILAKQGYIKINAEQDNQLIIAILDSGKVFIRSADFVSLNQKKKEEIMLEEEQREQRKASHSLTIKQIRAYKREPYLIAWSIISTLATIILTILQLKKQ